MTQHIEKLLKEHNKEWEDWVNSQGSRVYNDNLYYSIITEDGEVISFFDRVCFAGIRYGEYYDRPDDDEDYEDPAEDTSSYATIDAIIVEPYGNHLNPVHHKGQLSEYHRALRAWCELFSPFLLPREEDSSPIIVDMTTNADLDCVGAFLVGFRNMHEQGHYRMFNHLIDSGLPLPIAAYGSQLLRLTNGNCEMANDSHNTISYPPSMMKISVLKKQKNKCKLYDQKQMIGKSKHRGSFMWTLSENFYPESSCYQSSGGTLQEYLEPATVVQKGRYEWITFRAYPIDTVSPLFVELLK